MASHRISLVKSQTPGPFDIYYRLQNEYTYTLLLSSIYDVELTAGICVTLPSNAVEMKIVNKHLNANIEVFRPIPV